MKNLNEDSIAGSGSYRIAGTSVRLLENRSSNNINNNNFDTEDGSV